jgi:hypothetical protein
MEKKQEMDSTENPAMRRIIRDDLSNKIVEINNLMVKNVTNSTVIDYDYCVIADSESEGKSIEFYIYSNDITTLSKLKKGESVIDVRGRFGKFFTMLDNYYTKIDILNASIKPSIKASTKNGDNK